MIIKRSSSKINVIKDQILFDKDLPQIKEKNVFEIYESLNPKASLKDKNDNQKSE
jgi:hypothetical protein